ncbi:two component transcriptional regulator, winged helix family [Allomeiothermus silvanus DSM 9946]|uniref:Two component transcriptional regulator, winged helix family n=1 Tax=Allomeiothermus silvanus (strain ATCC 700542 / DSM 9946 / NBRC 106475 / NCIMB 13440 / VI-R2) TaxID=526227 RepID=D7BB92_ALLS1|nr:response regulator transcription factor [Allomeiothermus silvanus]ADH62652.1 two component transcriptional regulator, winged helix family [Allomeiothermus silvanus DSM 9946]
MSTSILIVEDEIRLAEILEDYLRREGYKTERAKDGGRALELWRVAQPDLILLDLMLPVLDGLEVARRIRAESDVPIIMLTARDDEVDKLVGLGLGADDYVVKPYSPREVVARVKAVLRRVRGAVLTQEVYRAGSLEVDLGAFEARCGGEPINLTPSELKLLALLAKEPGRVRQRSELLTASGDAESYADERTVDAHIKNIRRKLGECGERIETVRGVGYKLRG